MGGPRHGASELLSLKAATLSHLLDLSSHSYIAWARLHQSATSEELVRMVTRKNVMTDRHPKSLINFDMG